MNGTFGSLYFSHWEQLDPSMNCANQRSEEDLECARRSGRIDNKLER